jgi:CheY-like chemotaxis protein
MKPKVLVADDLPDVQEMVKESLTALSNDGVEILQALDIISAKRMVKDNPDIKVIVMDYYMPLRADDPKKSVNINTIDLIHELRERFLFKGSIIAASSDEDNRKLQLAAGCDCETEKRAENIAKKVMEVLNLS